ncbi:MAG: hypothetical protein QOI80_990 [Solirubrobacteraceae bacterium]|nr:hypothetical protein [Solirubrobacteraceae bacterium]
MTKAPPTQARDYAALNITWAGAVVGLLQVSDGEAPHGSELPVLGLAAFSLAKALSKEKIGSWIRQPLVEPDPAGGRRPKGRGLRHTLGELITCTRCVGTWSSLGLVGLRVARPREGRIVANILAVSALNDWLQTGYSYACSRANAVS